MKIGLVQMNSGRDYDANIVMLKSSLASVKHADIIVTPECTNLMGFNPRSDQLHSEQSDPVVAFCRQWAFDNKTAILLGSVLIKDGADNVNRQILIDGDGEIITRYDKIHMFDIQLPSGEVYNESDKFRAGQQACVSELAQTKFGHSICFDVRFPKLYRALAQGGAEVLLVPSAFTQATGQAHWEVLLRARAIENGAFVVAPAQTGYYLHHDGSTRKCFGHSMIVSPWGDVLCNLGEFASTKVVDIDLKQVATTRNLIPALYMEREFQS